jgi:hypothetical protein
MFFGGNTPKGFYQCFSDILFLDEAVKIVYIKGSAGSGKSTLMRKVAKAFESAGADVDYIHCANNTEDLDGICMRDKGIAIIDGTMPHACDPQIPVAVDEIFNTADFLDKAHIEQKREQLLNLDKQKKPYFQKAYNYLSGAYSVYLNNIAIYAANLNRAGIFTVVCEELLRLKDIPIAQKQGRNRRMFARAITPNGVKNYMDTLFNGMEVVSLSGRDGMGIDETLEKIREAANARGLSTESCYSPFDVSKIEHLIIPELKLCYVTENELRTLPKKAAKVIDFFEFVNMRSINSHKDEIAYNTRMFNELMDISMKMISGQKNIHDEIEKIYIAGLDFDGLDKAAIYITERLLNMGNLKS